jgi:hypothetical protein
MPLPWTRPSTPVLRVRLEQREFARELSIADVALGAVSKQFRLPLPEPPSTRSAVVDDNSSGKSFPASP